MGRDGGLASDSSAERGSEKRGVDCVILAAVLSPSSKERTRERMNHRRE